MTRNERQRDLVQTLNGADIALNSITADSITADKSGRVYDAPEGELQATLDEAAAENSNYFFGGWQVVRCQRGQSYTSPPYTIPPSVVLDMNGAEIGTNQQVNLLEPDPGSTLVGPGFFRVNADPYTESVLYLDSSKGTYSPKGGNDPFHAMGVFHIEGPDQPGLGDQGDLESNGIHLDAAVGGNAITNLYLGQWVVKQMHNSVTAEADQATNAFVNNIHLSVEGLNCNRYWRHAGDFGAKVLFYASHVQGGDFDRVFYNDTGSVNSCTFRGHIEDPQVVGTEVINGAGMKIVDPRSSLSENLHSFTMGDGTTVNGMGHLPGVAGSPSGNVTNTAYAPGERIVTGDGLYEKGIDPGTQDWIQIASGTFT